jgi:hypothetical protein
LPNLESAAGPLGVADDEVDDLDVDAEGVDHAFG